MIIFVVMNKFSSQTGLVAEGSDTLSAEFEKNQSAMDAQPRYTSSSAGRGKPSNGQDIHMTDLNNIHIDSGRICLNDDSMCLSNSTPFILFYEKTLRASFIHPSSLKLSETVHSKLF